MKERRVSISKGSLIHENLDSPPVQKAVHKMGTLLCNGGLIRGGENPHLTETVIRSHKTVFSSCKSEIELGYKI